MSCAVLYAFIEHILNSWCPCLSKWADVLFACRMEVGRVGWMTMVIVHSVATPLVAYKDKDEDFHMCTT